MKRALKFIWTYRLFSLAIAGAIVGLILQLLDMRTASAWVLGTVAIIEVFPLLKDMFEDVRSGRYGIDILAATAIVFSVVLQENWAAIVLVIMITGGVSLERYAERRAHSELNALLKQAPQIAHVIRARKTVDIKASEVHVGDKVIVKPGEIIPVDAEIIEGATSVDEASLTGESLPHTKQVGDLVLSGSINQEGVITVKALRTSDDSQYQQIIKLVQGASASQAPFVRLADRYSIPFTVAAFSIATAAWIIGGEAIRFLQVIVVATPCPLLLAAPIALVSGMARASKFGIIVKSGSALEKLAETETIAFDKTGTLTKGELSVTDVLSYGAPKETVISLAASVEQQSNHILAKAITEIAHEQNIKTTKVKRVQELAGQGLKAQFKGQEVLVGNYALLENHNVTFPANFKRSKITQTAVYVATNGELAGVLLLQDTIREDSQVTLSRLKRLGITDTLLITGDAAASARPVAKALGIKQMYAEALPGEKLQILEAITNRPLTYVGDGVNDAPSLTAADVGIAIGARGSTAASESADMVILPDSIGHVAIAVAIAQRTLRIAKQSILVGIGLSLALMAVFSTGEFSPLLGAILQEVVDVVVILNALRAHFGTTRI